MAALSLLCGELALHAAAALWSPAAVWVRHHRVPDDMLGWRLNPAYPDVDRWGFRNPRVPDSTHVVILGDSQTYGYGVPPEASWPRVFQARTGLATYNVAASGYSPVHGLAMWGDVARLRPRVVVAAVYAGNDLYDTFQLAYRQGQLPHLRSGERMFGRIVLLEHRQSLEEMAREVTRMGRPTWPLRDVLRQYSAIFSLLRHAGHSGAALGGRDAASWARQRARAAQHPDYLHAFDGGPTARTVFTVPKRLLPQDVADARIAEGLRVTLRALGELQRRSAELGARCAIVWIPTKELVFAPAVDAAGGAPARFAQLRAAEANFHSRVRAEATAMGVPFIDTLPALRRRLAAGTTLYPVTADGHPNAAGYAEIAAVVAGALAAP